MDADGADELSFPARHIGAQPEPIDVTDAQNGAYTFRGLFAPIAKGNTTIVAGDYIIGEQGFRRAAGGNASKAFRAFIAGNNQNASAPQRLSVSFDGQRTTAINIVESDADGQGAIYNLSGQRVAAPTRGIYIINHKKVIIK